ncbi:MAG: translation initiation factor IF-2 N-terminal domain-containing protein, partial [Desulfobulbus sp.]|nr:translation initiation factor IF-2 N-terminal domain-containing protein [Desulfobulbus sp.]
MSKVRVYDLAKEFGLKSKELADKLVAMGYPVASHSSSVDEDMAADIRRKLSGEGVAVHTDGRLGLRGRAAEPAPAKGTTVIRRRSRAEKEEAARKQEEVEAQTLEAETEAMEARVQEQLRDLKTPPTEEPEAEEAEAVAEAGEQPAPAEPAVGGEEEGAPAEESGAEAPVGEAGEAPEAAG